MRKKAAVSESVDSLEQNNIKFTGAKMCKADCYKHKADICSTLLESEEMYTFEEVDLLIENFMKGVV